MVFSFLRRPQAELDLTLDGDRFSPGDTIKASVSVASRKGFDVRRGAVVLECVETYWEWQTTNQVHSHGPGLHTGRTSRREKKKRQRTIFENYADFMGEGAIPGGIPQRHDVTIKVPDDAPPSVEGKWANLRWQARLSVDVPGARDLHREQSIVVTPRLPAQTPDGREAPRTSAEDSFGDGSLRLELQGDGWRAGEAMRGTFRLDTRDSVEFEEVRVELERYEEAGETSGDITVESVVVERGVTVPGIGRREWPFTLTVPQGVWPTTRVSRTVVRWRVKGICARRLRGDHRVEVEVMVR